MNFFILIALMLGLAIAAGLLVLVCSALRAPEGYETADGFHLNHKRALTGPDFVSAGLARNGSLLGYCGPDHSEVVGRSSGHAA